MKTCSICKEEKELDKFNKRKERKDGYESRCKECQKATREANPNYKETQRKANAKQDAKRKGKRWGYHLSKTYGLSEESYYKMYEEQDGRCAICDKKENKEEHYGKFVVDHCHNTGHVRGLLCNQCNLMIGNAKDDTTTLNNAIKYLKETK